MKGELHGSESFRRLNPHIFPPVGRLAASDTQHPAALVSRPPRQQNSKGGVAVRVHLIARRRRILDDDNATAACKPLRDAIAESLGIDDGDGRISWEYSQAETKGEQGVIVKIERVK